MDLDLFLELLKIDSTSGREGELADYIIEHLDLCGGRLEVFPASEGKNILISWGDPQIVFCTHYDTVPPYIAPTVEKCEDGRLAIRGRGTCDAKGQVFAMYNACLKLASEGRTGFGLLLLYGEETGSFGAKSFRDVHPGGDVVIVGEPTDNRMVSASKGTKSFEVTVRGKSFHSGYPLYGASAVERFVDLMNALRGIDFPIDPRLGETTWNVGKLRSDNAQNILSDHLTFRIYFRTTFASDAMVCKVMEDFNDEWVSVKAFGGDTPGEYLTLEGFGTKTVAFGSDAPQLTNFSRKALCGPGSILVAHTDAEYIYWDDIATAVDNYVAMFHRLRQDRNIE